MVLLLRPERIWRDRRAQDLIEYSLLAAFVATTASAIFPPVFTPVVNGIWMALLDGLSRAAQAAGS